MMTSTVKWQRGCPIRSVFHASTVTDNAKSRYDNQRGGNHNRSVVGSNDTMHACRKACARWTGDPISSIHVYDPKISPNKNDKNRACPGVAYERNAIATYHDPEPRFGDCVQCLLETSYYDYYEYYIEHNIRGQLTRRQRHPRSQGYLDVIVELCISCVIIGWLGGFTPLPGVYSIVVLPSHLMAAAIPGLSRSTKGSQYDNASNEEGPRPKFVYENPYVSSSTQVLPAMKENQVPIHLKLRREPKKAAGVDSSSPEVPVMAPTTLRLSNAMETESPTAAHLVQDTLEEEKTDYSVLRSREHRGSMDPFGLDESSSATDDNNVLLEEPKGDPTPRKLEPATGDSWYRSNLQASQGTDKNLEQRRQDITTAGKDINTVPLQELIEEELRLKSKRQEQETKKKEKAEVISSLQEELRWKEWHYQSKRLRLELL